MGYKAIMAFQDPLGVLEKECIADLRHLDLRGVSGIDCPSYFHYNHI